MAVSQDSIQQICDKLSAEVAIAYEGLTLHFIVHGAGKLRESVALAEHDIIAHPAGNAARVIVQKNALGERSKFLGLAIARERRMMGLKKFDHLLALFTINADHFRSKLEVTAQIYHLIWHAIDLYEIREKPRYKNKFKSGPMVPRRSPLNLSKANLQADAFAGVLAVLNSDEKNPALVDLIAQKRGIMSLSQITDYKAEDYPSVIAIEACEIIIGDILKNPRPKEEYLHVARQVSIDVGRAFDEQNIQQWWDYCIPAQDMAWRGFTKEEILGAAINTSDDPFVRSIGYLIEEVTNVEPSPAHVLAHSYNAFLDPEVNMRLHRDMIDSVFEEALSEGGDNNGEATGEALIKAANKQNEDLTEGRFLGWCAGALQDAAKAVERALISGTSPTQAARMQFEGNKYIPKWDDLKDLSNKIVDQKKQGLAVTMGNIAEICHDNPAFAPVLNSIKMTMNDPSYVQKLEAANDFVYAPSAPAPKGPELGPKAPGPKAPELGPKGHAPDTPAPIAPPTAAPTLGGSGRGSQIARQRYLMAQQQKEKDGKGNKSSQDDEKK